MEIESEILQLSTYSTRFQLDPPEYHGLRSTPNSIPQVSRLGAPGRLPREIPLHVAAGRIYIE